MSDFESLWPGGPVFRQAAQLLPLQPLRAQDVRAEAVALGQDAEQQMLRPDAAVSQLSGGRACALDGVLRPLCKLLVASDRSTLPMPLSARAVRRNARIGDVGESIPKCFSK